MREQRSTRPYLLRALHEWCTDNGLTPYIMVRVDDSVQVPREYVHNGEIVLNVSHDATSGLQLGNDFVEFKARFGGRPHSIMIPIGRVMAIYARENGQGMAFASEEEVTLSVLDGAQEPEVQGTPPSQEEGARSPVLLQPVPSSGENPGAEPPTDPAPTGGRPTLKRVK